MSAFLWQVVFWAGALLALAVLFVADLGLEVSWSALWARVQPTRRLPRFPWSDRNST